MKPASDRPPTRLLGALPAAVAACVLACAALLAACHGDAPSDRARVSSRRDVDELQRIRRDPRVCEATADCPTGSHCDEDAGRCAWACLADSECGRDAQCDLLGTCVATSAAISHLANDTIGCQAIPAASRRAALIALSDSAQQGDFITCDGDETCPCGAHCSADAICQVDCLADTPTPALTCGAGQACTALGRCAASSSDPGPPLALTLALSQGITRANTATAPVVIPLTVTVAATSFDVLQPQNPAVVKLSFAELRDFEQGRVATPPSPAPRVKCQPGDALANSCVLDGGWTFDVGAGTLRSAPRTIWVELPQTLIAQHWTLEARSEWAADPAIDVIEAAPVIIPATDPGHYQGTLVIANDGAIAPADSTLRLPIEAIVTASHVALLEPTRVMLPEGHAVLARAAGKATMLRWLTGAGAAGYDVALTLPAIDYDPATGHLHLAIAAATGTGAAPTTLNVDLERTADVDAACPATACSTGSYCDAAIGRCLAGSAPAAGGGIVDAASAAGIPSSALPSSELAAWLSPLTTVATSNASLLAGTGAAGIERAYCFEATTQPGPARFAASSTLLPISLDQSCQRGGASPTDYPQPTFKFEEQDREYDAATHFDLYETCLADLGVQPTGPATAANLLSAKSCVSLGRFFLAMNANAAGGTGQPLRELGQRLVGQLLRQWLGVHAYVASSAIQSRQYDDALAASSVPAQDRLGTAVDLMAQGLGVLIDPRVKPQYATGSDLPRVLAAPDYRVPGRPIARWTFNERTSPAPDAESANAFIATGVDLSGAALHFSGAAGARSESSQPVALDDRQFTIAMYLPDVAHTKLFEKIAPNGDRLWTEVSARTLPTAPLVISLKDSFGGVASFSIPPDSDGVLPARGMLAWVADNGSYYLYTYASAASGLRVFPGSVTGSGPRWGAPGIVRLAGAGTTTPCTPPRPGCVVPAPAVTIDEVALFNRPIQSSELVAMAERYAQTPANESLPAKSQITLPGKDQSAGVAVHIVEAASADLDLLTAYIEAERSVMYEECYLGGASPARDRVAARAGTSLRLITVLEGEAVHLAAVPDAAASPWYARYQAGHRELAGRRARAIRQLQLAGECRNPLGIAEEDLPLFVGEEVGPSAKFFASSRFLTSKARDEIALAQGKLSSAQTKYIEQRQSAYQLNQARESKVLRESKMRTDYESALRRMCGTPAGTQTLLDGFLAGTLDAGNCFLKTELPACQNLGTTPAADLPASCLRGDIGARLLAIQSAGIDMANAGASRVRATQQYDADMVYCGRRQEAFDANQKILEKHYAFMQTLRGSDSFVSNVLGVPTGILHFDVREVMNSLSSTLHSLGIDMGIRPNGLQQQKEAEDYQAVVEAQSHALDIAECYHRAANEKFSIDAARDVIVRGAQEITTALFNLDNDRNALAGVVDEAAGQLAIEAGIDSTPPHLHYWLDADITEYHRHLEFARRLTYLALRAFEYEAQQSIGHRGETLTARQPDDLLTVVTAIEQRNAPMQGELGLVIGARPVVLSLRDEILRILDVSASPNRLPGEPALTPEQALKAYLASESSKIIGSDGRYLGRGIRFALRPSAWSETSCAERIWRITPSLQIDNPPTQHGMVLYQDNAFGSQDCRAEFGAVTVSRAESSVNLLVGDTASFSRPSSFTAMNIDGPLGLDHETLRARPEGDLAGFAGRGLYGNYVLLFPPLTWPDAEIAKVKDLLLRFDIVELSHPPAL